MILISQVTAVTQSAVTNQATLSILTSPIFLGAVRLSLIILGIIYFIYALILVRQIQMLNEMVKTNVGNITLVMGLIHLGLAGLLIFYLIMM